VVSAVQVCVEEYFLDDYEIPPLLIVGWEGFWGLCFISIAICGMYQVYS